MHMHMHTTPILAWNLEQRSLRCLAFHISVSQHPSGTDLPGIGIAAAAASCMHHGVQVVQPSSSELVVGMDGMNMYRYSVEYQWYMYLLMAQSFIPPCCCCQDPSVRSTGW